MYVFLFFYSELWVDHNFLYGSFPSSFGGLTNLRELMVEQNAIEGSVPTELGQLTSMERLRLYENQFSGTISDEICNLRSSSHNDDGVLYALEVDCKTKIQCHCCTKCA